jgi:regulator of replication initiation timing
MVFGDTWLLPGLFFIVAARQKARVFNMLENSLSQLEQLVSDLVQANKALQRENAQLSSELAQIKDENDNLQLSAIEQEELHGATIVRIQALVELATGSNTVKASPANV